MSAAVVGLLSAALVGLLAAGGQWISIRASGRERRKDQRLTWARDDEVARKAAEAAALLLAAQRESIARTDEVAEHVANATAKTEAKLEVIHTLVNSTLTAALLASLDASRSELVTLLRMADMQRAHGEVASEDELVAIAALRRKVGELSAAMQDREAQTRAADAQIATEAARRADGP